MRELRRRGAWLPDGLPWVGCCALILLAGAVNGLSAGSAAQKPTTATEQCVNETCHAGILNHKVMHGPVAQKKCQACHQYAEPREHRFKPLAEPDQGCTECHEMKPKAVVHAPVKDGRCTVCHDPHGSAYKGMLVGDPVRGLCLGCHKEDYSKKKFVHGPLTSSACTVCHEAHSAAQPKLLRDSSRNLCVGCHKEVVPAKGEEVHLHAPMKDNCVGCHDPHASDLKYELKQAAPNLCFSCHKNVKESLAASTVVHAAMTQEGGCSGCHAPHFSKLPKLQKLPQPEECLSCHDRELKSADGTMLTNMAALLKDNPEHHGPIRLGSCTACHEPHAGNHARLLISAYPEGFYAPFQIEQYALCFRCHTPNLVLQPQGIGLTRFRDGEKNLHWLHVNREKGRTCRACHEVHASRLPFHIREAVPFGTSGWMLPINYQQTPSGGSCAPGCHERRTYDNGGSPRIAATVGFREGAVLRPDREAPKPVAVAASGAQGAGDYPVSAPPFSEGIFPCTGCHDPKLPVNTQRRVLRAPHSDIQLHHDEEHRWCLDCHNADNRDVLRSASGAPIPFAESYRLCGQCHGDKYADWKAGVHGKRTGEWDGRKDYLLCVSCHDPHAPRFKPTQPLPPPVRPGQGQ
jgi:predicted CXXCH cytochrome family protein